MTTSKPTTLVWALMLVIALASGAFCETYYVATNGSSTGTGTYADPWDLETGLAKDTVIQPGDTLFLRGGTYGSGDETTFTCTLDGTQANRITVAGFPGETATIDGMIEALTGASSWVIFRDLVVTNSDTDREGIQPDERVGGFTLSGSGVSIVNCVMHDTGHPAIGYWEGCGDGSEINGCIIWGTGIYDTGESTEDPVPSGSAIYAQNLTGTRTIKEIISFRNFTCGIKPYAPMNGHVDGFHIEGNTSFDNGLYNIMVSGQLYPPERLEVKNNRLWRRATDGNEGIRVPFSATAEDAEFTGNYIVNGTGPGLHIRKIADVTVTGNTIIGRQTLAEYKEHPTVVSETWNNNTYYAPSEVGAEHDFQIVTQDWGVAIDAVIFSKDDDLSQNELDTIAEDVLEEEETPPTDTVVLDAEDFALTLVDDQDVGWNIISDANAFNGQALQADASLGENNQNGVATKGITFPSTGTYEMYFRVRTEDMDSDTLLNHEDNIRFSRGDLEGVFSETTYTQANRVTNTTYMWMKASDAYLGERFVYDVESKPQYDTPFKEEDVDEYDFADWKTQTGFDASSTLTWPLPATNQVFVVANDNEVGRGHVTIYNWAEDASVAVDLSSILSSGDQYEIIDAQNYFGSAVAQGTYTSGTVSIPMNQTTVAQPLGQTPQSASAQAHWTAYCSRFTATAPGFGCFLVRLKNPTFVVIDASDAEARELDADPGKFTVRRSGPTTSGLTVNYTVSGTATSGTDYVALSGSVYIPAGQSSATIVVTPYNDTTAESDETVIVTLATGTGYHIHPTADSATVTIDNRYVISSHTLAYEAEDAALSLVDSEQEGWNVISDSDAFGASAIQADASLGQGNNNGIAEIEITFPEAGTYELYYRCRSEDMDSDQALNHEDNFRLSRGDLENVFSATTYVQSNRAGIADYTWLQASDAVNGTRFVYTVEAGEVDVPQTLQIVTQDWGVVIDAIIVSKTGDLTNAELNDIAEQLLTAESQDTLAFNMEDFALGVTDPEQEGWNLIEDDDAYGGRTLETDPSLGDYNYNGVATLNVTFSEAGTYELYYRAKTEDMNDDESLNIEDEVAFSRGDLENVFSTTKFRQSNRIRVTSYTWFKASGAYLGERFVYTVESGEVLTPQTFRVYTTDWGVKMDAIVFSKDDSLTSTQLDAIAAERLE